MSERSVSPLNSEALTLKALTILADHLEQAAREIRELFQDWTPLEYKGTLVGRIRQVENRVEFIPVESLAIKMDDPAIERFLKPRVLEKAKEKHGWNYQIVKDQSGLLDRVVLYGDLKDSDIKELMNPVGWTFSVASGRPQK